MKKDLPSAVTSHAPLAAVLLALMLASLSPALSPHGVLPLAAGLPFWILVGALAALHRPLDRPRPAEQAAVEIGPSRSSLGLGTLALAPAIDLLGAVPAVIVAAAAFLLAEVGGALVERRTLAGMGTRLTAALTWVAPVAAAVLAAGAALTFVAVSPQTTGAPSDGLATLSMLAGRLAPVVVAYGLTFALVAWWTLRLRRGLVAGAADRPGDIRTLLRPLVLDAAGWGLGVLLAQAAPTLGRTRIGLFAAALALLAAEAARQAMLERASDHRAGRLERMQRAHARILGETSGVGEIAEQIFAECRRVLPVQWFQLEVEAGEEPGAAEAGESEDRTSWAAGPDGVLRQGRPRPAERPRTLPGIHRRVAWRVLEKPLEAEGETLAVVRLWCDPRRIKPGAEELFSALVPQMASSVHRTRLERQARLDPLTGIPLRRPFESGLERAYRQSCEEGLSMAVVMCDIDFFKRINDTHGHAAGDQALILVARTLDSRRREDDLCCRYGGEEFTLLLEGTGGERALRLAERLRRAVESLDMVFEDRSIPLTLSAGVAAFPELHAKNASELLLLADEALYEAKEQGRNRSLLNLGQGTFRAPTGALVRSGPAPERRLPRIFG